MINASTQKGENDWYNAETEFCFTVIKRIFLNFLLKKDETIAFLSRFLFSISLIDPFSFHFPSFTLFTHSRYYLYYYYSNLYRWLPDVFSRRQERRKEMVSVAVLPQLLAWLAKGFLVENEKVFAKEIQNPLTDFPHIFGNAHLKISASGPQYYHKAATAVMHKHNFSSGAGRSLHSLRRAWWLAHL